MAKELDRFAEVVSRLRGPGGCPWDKEQTHKSLFPYLLDEAYEFFDAVDEASPGHMAEELGDLLLQVFLHAQIGSETGLFDIEKVAAGISDKLIRRHPHVFGDTKVNSSGEVVRNWEEIKGGEKDKQHRISALDDIPKNLPALFMAEKVQRRAARVGFDWPGLEPVLDKVEEEFREFREAVATNDAAAMEDELGDIIFALVNVARHKGIFAENALQSTVKKFSRRFRYVEDSIKKLGKKMEESTLEEMDVFWEESKGIVG
jgi:tetrapyrrole methylase family protein / MazG family protein